MSTGPNAQDINNITQGTRSISSVIIDQRPRNADERG